MISYLVFNAQSGVITRSGSAPTEDMARMQDSGEYKVLINCGNDVRPNTHYICEGDIQVYSDAELQTKNNIPQGFIWKMPERVAVDTRTETQQAEDTAQAVLDSRAAEYPPLADLADALYWQQHGDQSKMDVYLARCAAVKVRFPKQK